MQFGRSLVKSDLGIFTLVFIAIMLVTVIGIIRQPRMYEASATLKYQRAMMMGAHEARPPQEDWNELRVALKSSDLIRRATGRLSEAERTGFIAPYAAQSEESEAVFIESLIAGNQRASFDGSKGELTIKFQHPDRLVAARVLNGLIDEVIAYQARKRIDESMKEVEELKPRVEAQQRHVQELAKEMTAYRERSEKTIGTAFVADEGFEAMHKRHIDAGKLLDKLIARMREISMISGPATQFWRREKKAVPPDEDGYLIAPSVRSLARGLALAVVGGFFAVGVRAFFTRKRGLAGSH